MRLYFALTLTVSTLCGWAAAAELEKAPILLLRPTQIAVGMIAVDDRGFQSMEHGDLEDYMKKHPVNYVEGPKDQESGERRLYIDGDHHHESRGLWEAGVKKLVIVKTEDFSKLSLPDFQQAMLARGALYPYDQFGNGPHDLSEFPTDVRGMPDDPYRSLAGRVRRMGGYDKTSVRFAEFKWGEFFRKNLTIKSVNDRFDDAVQEALSLTKSPMAADLPGYIGDARSR